MNKKAVILFSIFALCSTEAVYAESDAAKAYLDFHKKQMETKSFIPTAQDYTEDYLKKHVVDPKDVQTPEQKSQMVEMMEKMFGGVNLTILKDAQSADTAALSLVDAKPTKGFLGMVKKNGKVEMKKVGGVWKINSEEWSQSSSTPATPASTKHK